MRELLVLSSIFEHDPIKARKIKPAELFDSREYNNYFYPSLLVEAALVKNDEAIKELLKYNLSVSTAIEQLTDNINSPQTAARYTSQDYKDALDFLNEFEKLQGHKIVSKRITEFFAKNPEQANLKNLEALEREKNKP